MDILCGMSHDQMCHRNGEAGLDAPHTESTMNHSRLVRCIGIGGTTFILLCMSCVVFMIFAGMELFSGSDSLCGDARSIPCAIAKGFLMSPGGVAIIALLIGFRRAYFRYRNW
jgi:hypothetical protein